MQTFDTSQFGAHDATTLEAQVIQQEMENAMQLLQNRVQFARNAVAHRFNTLYGVEPDDVLRDDCASVFDMAFAVADAMENKVADLFAAELTPFEERMKKVMQANKFGASVTGGPRLVTSH